MKLNNTSKKIENIIEDNMMGYAAAVLLDRALPDLRDGLKPVHRRLLFTMHLQKAHNFTKSANISGANMKIHPHGSSYGVMVGMAQKDNQLTTLLEGKGSFGQRTSKDLQAAADRYTEVKLSQLSIDMMKDFDKNVVNFIDNYDGTLKMPEVLPVKFPYILSSAQSGIGVGFSSSTASYNLNEICDATIKYIKSNKHSILIPDFATGGSIINEPEIFKQINETGSGSVKLRSTVRIEGNKILITEIPYSTTREAIIKRIIELAKTIRLKEVIDIKDLTGLKGLLITITARRNTDMNLLLQKLYQFTPLQSTYSSNMNILINNLPKVLGTQQIIEEWLKWRKECISRSLKYDIIKMENRLHLLKGLEKVILDIDKTIDIIRKSKEELIEKNLKKYFELDDEQAIEVSNMKLRNINKDYIVKKIKDIKKLEEDIEIYKDILKDDKKIDKIIIEDLNETKKKYGQSRRTIIIEDEIYKPIIIVEEIPNYEVSLFLTKDGYCYKFKGDQKPNLKPGDEILKSFKTINESEIVIFGKDYICYKIKTNNIEETHINSLGTYLPGLLENNNLEIASYSVVDDKNKFLIMIYKNNKIAKVPIAVLVGSRSILKHAFNKNQELLDILTLQNESRLKLTTDKTKVEIDTTTLTPIMNRASNGVFITRKGIALKIEVV